MCSKAVLLAVSGDNAGTRRENSKGSPSSLMDRAAEMGLRANRAYPLVARLRDLLFGTIALFCSLPILLILGYVARWSTGASALFRQVRVGRDGQHFTVGKLRTMPAHAPSDVNKKQAEHMVTPMGRFMRRYKLDELPQFWNVVRGEMSLVGPRPIIPQEYPGGEIPLRLAVRPGLTGLWQLSRVREQPFDKNPEYDLFYLANRTMAFDLWLIWRTVLLIVIGRETKIRLAARLWERNPAWRELVPSRSRSIPARTGRLRSRVYMFWLAGTALLAFSPGVAIALSAKGDLLEAQNALAQARQAAARLDAGVATAELETARRRFEGAEGKLSSWPTLGLRAIPGLNNNLEVPQAFAAVGVSLVKAGGRGLEILENLPLEGGRVAASLKGGVLDLAPFGAAEGPARALQAKLDQAQRQLNATPTSFLLPTVADARGKGIEALADATREADIASGAAFLIPRLFGADGPRNWIIGAENNAELRGRGGYVGSLGMLSSNNGQLSLADFRPTSGLPSLPRDPTLQGTVEPEYFRQYLHLGGTVAWQNLLMSPDFPTGAKLLLANLQTVANMSGDGLIALDPVALSYLLRATGPVDVPGIPESLTSENVVDWSLNKIYFLVDGENDERKELLSVIASTVWRRLLSDPDLNAREVAMALGQALSERRLVIYSTHRDEQRVIEQLGIGGSLEPTEDDYLLLVGQNVAENKMDYYLSRAINYVGVIKDDGSMQVEVNTTVTHTASAGTEFPDYIGGTREDLPAGSARNFVSLFVPSYAQLQEVLKDGNVTSDFENSTEHGMRRLGTNIEVAPGESRTVTYRYHLPDAVFDGIYRINVQRQATVKPDTLSVHIKPAEGTVITDRWGFGSGEDLLWQGEVRSDLEFGAELESPLWPRMLNQLTSLLRRPVAGAAVP
jgi:lipopolysaccharide/colanic/teichoic acid biosynthesis glycosyltransferase